VPRILHLVKDPRNATALEVIRAQASQPDVQLSVVLMQDAVRLSSPLPGHVYRLQVGHADLASEPGPGTIGSAQLLDLIFAADSVVTW
jgi:hypothetical protein